MNAVLWITGAVVVLYSLHRLGTWMEDRGWIYYRKKRGNSGAISSAVLEVQQLFEPAHRHVIEVKKNDERRPDRSGDPPGPV